MSVGLWNIAGFCLFCRKLINRYCIKSVSATASLSNQLNVMNLYLLDTSKPSAGVTSLFITTLARPDYGHLY